MNRSALIRGAGQGRAARGAQKRARSELAFQHGPVVQGRLLLQAHGLVQRLFHDRLLSIATLSGCHAPVGVSAGHLSPFSDGALS